MSPDHGRGWQRALGFFVDNPIVVLLLTGMLVVGGLYVIPFNVDVPMARDPVPVDAIPDIGENQQIVFTSWPGRSPRDIEDQISYPLTTALLGIPGVRTVRSSSMFGFSSIYVIFNDGVDFYWSRSRVLEKLASLPSATLPDGVAPTLGPDATALGQVFWYTLEGRDPSGQLVGGWDLHELRSVQDWTVRYALQSVPGVAEVASVGGHVQEYQIDVDPEAMLAYGVTLAQIARAVRSSNLDVGARTLEINSVEYVIRSLGFVQGLADLENTVITTREHTPVRVRDVARVGLGPAQRRGLLDDAGAEVAGGVVVARYGANPMAVIAGIKEKVASIAPGLPSRQLDDGRTSRVTVVPFYDRSQLIDETLETLSTTLWRQILFTVIVVLVMLRSLRSSAVITATLPLAVLGAFVAMKLSGVDANVMALAGIAVAIGTMVDMGIVYTENIHRQLQSQPDTRRGTIVTKATAEVAPAVVTSVLTTVVSFLPVFSLTAAEGKLFTPLAFTKTFAMVAALGVATLVLPAAVHAFVPVTGRADVATGNTVARPGRAGDWLLGLLALMVLRWSLMGGVLLAVLAVSSPLAQVLPPRQRRWLGQTEVALTIVAVTVLLTLDWMPLGHRGGIAANVALVAGSAAAVLLLFHGVRRVYVPVLRWSLDNKGAMLVVPALVVLSGATTWLGFDRVFPLVPQAIRSSAPVSAIAHALPGLGREFMPPFDEGAFLYMPTTMPHASFGEARRMLQAMDAAIEAIPEVDRAVGKLGRADSPLDPAPISMFETVVTYHPEWGTNDVGERIRRWRDHIHSPKDIWDEIVAAAEAPGLTSAPMLMPINTRIVMLQSGMRAPLGVKIHGPSLEALEGFGLRLEEELKRIPGIRSETVFADRVVGKPYIELDLDRGAIGRYGLRIDDVQRVVQVALGGMTLTRTVEGRERYAVRVRYMREQRDSLDALRRVLIPAPGGEQIPLEQLATVSYAKGPQVIKTEDTFLTSYVLFDRHPDHAEVDVVESARATLAQRIATGALPIPTGVSFEFAGSYQNQVRSEQRLAVLIPVALALIFLLLYLRFRSISSTLIIFSGVAISMAGGFVLVWLYGRPGFLDVTALGINLADLLQVGTVNMSVAVWVGFIALLGIATDDGVIMTTYLDQRFREAPPTSVADIRQRAIEAGQRRMLPCLMTTATTLLALLPVITSSGRGADIMLPMALPGIGGMMSITLTLFTVPVLYALVAERRLAAKSDPGVR